MDVHRLLEHGARFVGLPCSMGPTVAIFEKFRHSEPIHTILVDSHHSLCSSGDSCAAAEALRNCAGPSHNNPAATVCFTQGIVFKFSGEKSPVFVP